MNELWDDTICCRLCNRKKKKYMMYKVKYKKLNQNILVCNLCNNRLKKENANK